MEEEEHEVYGREIPEFEGDMDPNNAGVDMSAADDDAVKLDEMKKRLKEMEKEAAALREMQAKVKKEMGSVQDPANAAANQANREEADTRSVFVGNVRSLQNLTLFSSFSFYFGARFCYFGAFLYHTLILLYPNHMHVPLFYPIFLH